MSNKNPIGQHIQRMFAPDDNWVVDDCQKSEYSTVTILNAASLAGRVQSEGRVPYTIYRDTGFEPVPPSTDPAVIKDYAKAIYEVVRKKVQETGNPNVHIMINCEQGHAPHRIKMYTELIKLAATDTRPVVGMVFGNSSVGSVKTGFWGEQNDYERADMIEFLRTLDAYRNIRLASGAYAFILGVHNYSSQYVWIACNSGQHRIPTWDEANKIKIDWSLAQDHIGREYQGIRKALGWKWDNEIRKWYAGEHILRRSDATPVEPPFIILTEMLIDGVGGVPIQATKIDGNATPYGFNSMKTQWEQIWFKPDPHGLTLAKMSEWMWRVILQPEGYFIGGNNYCIGDTGGWQSHTTTPNGNPNRDYFNKVRTIRFNLADHFFTQVSTPPPPVEPLPPPPPPPPPTTGFEYPVPFPTLPTNPAQAVVSVLKWLVGLINFVITKVSNGN